MDEVRPLRGTNCDFEDVSGVVNDEVIDPEFLDVETQLRCTLPDDIFVGGGVGLFDYDDTRDLLDYDGTILTFSAGMTF